MITPKQCRAARGVLKWSQADLAKRVGLTPLSIRNFENDNPMRAKNQQAIREAFEAEGFEFPNEKSASWD